jgi:hypothetical protein
VAAATNPAVNSLPAFSGRRPDEAWLTQQLQDKTAAAAAAAMQSGQPLPDIQGTVASVLLPPVLASAKKLLQQQQQGDGAVAGAAGSGEPAGWLLLRSLCDALQSVYNTQTVPPQHLQPLTAGLVALLVQHSNLTMPATLSGLQYEAAKAGVTAAAASPAVAEVLLASAALPLPLLVQMLHAAVDSRQSAAVQQLLTHAEQHQLLQQLPPNLLLAALAQGQGPAAETSAGGANAGSGLAQQAVEILLQQGQAPDAAAAAALLPCTAAAEEQWQQLLAWLQVQCSSAPAAAAHVLLCDLLLASASKHTADQTWQLYQLLRSCQEAGSWPAAQQGLPAAVASAVIEQQAAAAAGSDSSSSSNRVLQLWDTQQQAAAGQKLTTAALEAVLSAFVASEQHSAALQLVQQQDAALLICLASLWQQQAPSTDVLVLALLQVCAFSSQLGSAAAANVAEQLLSLSEQQQGVQQAVQEGQTATAVQLVQLLSQQGKLAAALSVVSCMLEGLSVDAKAAAPAVAALVVAAANAAGDGVQQQVVQLLSQQPAGAEQQQAVLLAALDDLLTSKQAAAVGLLLHVLQASAREEQLLPVLLESSQLEQLAVLCCSESSSSSSSEVFTLPSPLQLAQQCVDSDRSSPIVVPAAVTVSLLKALAQQYPTLQPARAAVVFGLVSAEEMAAAGADSIGSDSTAATEDAIQACKLVAQLCYICSCHSSSRVMQRS